MSIWARPALTLKEATSGAGADSWAGTKLVGAAKVMVGVSVSGGWWKEGGETRRRKKKKERKPNDRPLKYARRTRSHLSLTQLTCEKTWGKKLLSPLDWLDQTLSFCLRSISHKRILFFSFLCELRLIPLLTHSLTHTRARRGQNRKY